MKKSKHYRLYINTVEIGELFKSKKDALEHVKKFKQRTNSEPKFEIYKAEKVFEYERLKK